MKGVVAKMPVRRLACGGSALLLGALTGMLWAGAAVAVEGARDLLPASRHSVDPGAGTGRREAVAASTLSQVSTTSTGDAVRRAAETARAGEASRHDRSDPLIDTQTGIDGKPVGALAEHDPSPTGAGPASPETAVGHGPAGNFETGSGKIETGGLPTTDSPGAGADHNPTSSASAPQAIEHPVADPQARGEHEDEAAVALIAGESETPRDPDAPWPKRRGPMPYEVVRSLQFLQDQVARGNGPAIRVQAILLHRYGRTFSEANPKVWNDSRNLRAAALFVLSGGSPMVLRVILSKVTLTGANRALFEGALAFVENRTAQAERDLSSLDLTFVETGLAAQINLALAQLQQQAKPKEALDRLKQVTLAAPGTLLEESALRMGVLIAESTGDRELSNRFARQYFDRFSGSAYAGNFRARFAAVYALRPAGTEDDTMATIADATATIPSGEQLGIYLAVARRSLVEGNLTLAAKASRKALTFADAARPDRQRALLYEIASTVTSRDFVQARTMLDAIDPKALHPADVKLRDAAFDVLAQMRRPLLADAGMPSLDKADAADAAPASVLARGNALLDAVNDDLKKASQ